MKLSYNCVTQLVHNVLQYFVYVVAYSPLSTLATTKQILLDNPICLGCMYGRVPRIHNMIFRENTLDFVCLD